VGFAQSPVPFVNQPLVPDAVAPGGPDFTLTVNGTGFVSGAVVDWNGSPLATQFVSASQLTATVPAADIAVPRTASVTVVNPAPGGGRSNVAFFSIVLSSREFGGFVLSSFSTLWWGSTPVSAATGDFNGDSKLDLAVGNQYGNAVSVLLGDGLGDFTLASSPVTDESPTSLAVGDFNGDGNLDLVVGNSGGVGNLGSVSVLLGDGTGNFTSYPATLVANQALAVGDLNGDGKLDLAVANGQNATIFILLGDGTGNFTIASSLTVGTIGPTAVGDFNRDGNLDLAISSFDTGAVFILLGDGGGGFTLSSSVSTGVGPSSIAAGDFNGDSKLDLAVANSCGSDPACGVSSTGSVSILLGDGSGNFTLASSPAAGLWPKSVVAGDLNGDGKLDLAVADFYGNTVTILLGDGAGNFVLASSPSAGRYPSSVVVGDFNGDGKVDAAATKLARQHRFHSAAVARDALPVQPQLRTATGFHNQLPTDGVLEQYRKYSS